MHFFLDCFLYLQERVCVITGRNPLCTFFWIVFCIYKSVSVSSQGGIPYALFFGLFSVFTRACLCHHREESPMHYFLDCFLYLQERVCVITGRNPLCTIFWIVFCIYKSVSVSSQGGIPYALFFGLFSVFTRACLCHHREES